MWGSWAGFFIGIFLVFVSFVFMYGTNPIQFAYYLNPIYLLINFILGILPIDTAYSFGAPAVLINFISTPLIFALYGYLIHSFLRRKHETDAKV